MVGQVYPVPPAGAPELPCAIINFPTVDAFHVDYAHDVTRLSVDVDVCVGRGDAEDAMRRLAELLSPDNPAGVVRVLEDQDNTVDPSWMRLTLVSSEPPQDIGDAIVVTVTLEIDA